MGCKGNSGEKEEKDTGRSMNMTAVNLLSDKLAASANDHLSPAHRIQTWALEEARRRLELEGILPDPDLEKKE